MFNFKGAKKKWYNLVFTLILIITIVVPPGLMVNVPVSQAADIQSQGVVADHVIISQIYGYGGSGPTEYLYKFVELYNPTDVDVIITGWSLQYAAAASNFAASGKIVLSGVIKARGYYLIQAGSNTNPPVSPANGKALPTPDASSSGPTSVNFNGTTGGKFALSNQNANLVSGSKDPSVVDFVGYGVATDSIGAPADWPGSRTIARITNSGLDPSVLGDGNGWYSGSNKNDFAAATPFPRNTSYQQEPEVVDLGAKDIAAIRTNNADEIPTTLGHSAVIEGVVTAVNLGTQKSDLFIQDATGGINVISSQASSQIQVGQGLKITGHVAFSKGQTQFIASEILELAGGVIPTPQPIEISDLGNSSTAESLEGKLVSMTGKVSNIPTSGADLNITVSDETQTAIVRILASSDIDASSILAVNESYTFIGVIGQSKSAAPYSSGYYLMPRSEDDIKGDLILIHDPIIETYPNLNVPVTAFTKYADSVTLYYRAIGETIYKSIDMIGDGNNYNATIPKEDVEVYEKIQYYLEAQGGGKSKSVGSAAAPIDVVVVEKATGPIFSDALPHGKIETMHPLISVKMYDPFGVNLNTVSIKIDGKDFSEKAEVTEREIKLALTSEDDLEIGIHTVEVSAKDNHANGNLSTHSWIIEVTERFTGGNHYLGTTHNHTELSHDAVGSPEQALKDVISYDYDWFVFSDHTHDIDAGLIGQDSVDHNGMPERTGGPEWQLTKDLSEQYTTDGEFVVFPGQEMTSTTWGHSNIIGAENFIDRKQDGGIYQDLQKYYAWILTYDDIVAQFNHPAMSKDAFDNFIPYDKKVDELFTMLEVGNGSGKYSYVNAENKFFNALDLGWHVAPTYGEDNHDATWGKTNRRTVIVANELTQESLLDAMRKMRVYMTEDKDFKFDVLASGFYMGATTDTKQLKFDITGNTNSNRTVSKVEILTNGATVIDSYEPKSKDINWLPDPINVAGGQQWFVVRVTLDNGDKAYSAPIWTPEEELSVKVSNVEAVDGAMIATFPAKLKAGISNLGVKNVKDLVAHFYYGSVDDNHKIGAATIESLPASTSAIAEVTWANPVEGNQKIIVVLEAKDGNDLGDNKYEKSFLIKEPLHMTLMIDSSRKNENTSTDTGTYKDNLKSLTTMMRKEAYTVVENLKPITSEVLKEVNILMISHPQTEYSADEILAINNFVRAGGSLLLAGKSNYTENQSPNSLLKGIGSSILINNDGVFDDSKSGNFWSDPLASKHSVRAHPKAVLDHTLLDLVNGLDYYSGASLAKNNGGNKAQLVNDENVTILVSGNETTYQNNTKADTALYNVYKSDQQPELVTGGSKIPLAAIETLGQGRVFVTAMNIFNDKQVDESFESKGNVPFAYNVVNWLAKRETTITPIGVARSLPEETAIVVQGTVTSAAGVFFDAFYLQDDTGGMMAFNEVEDGSLHAGDIVRVYGHVSNYEGNLEVEFGAFNQSVVKISSGPPIQPIMLTTYEALNDNNQGMFVKVVGKVTDSSHKNDASPYYIIDDESGPLTVFIDGYIVKQSGEIPQLDIGDTLVAVGYTAYGKIGDSSIAQIRVGDTKLMQKIDGITPVTGVTVNKTDVELIVDGVNSTVTAAVTPEEATNTAITWSSSDTNIAQVNKNTGVITGVSAGQAKITVTTADGGFSKEVTVTVFGKSPAAPNVTADNENKMILGIDATMEYNIDGIGWTEYNAANPPNLSGENIVQVRVKENPAEFTPVGQITTLIFSMNTSAPLLSGFVWTKGTTVGTMTTAIPDGNLKYVVGAAGSITRPNVGELATAYTQTLAVNQDIVAVSGQHIFIVSIDGNNKIIGWADIAVKDSDLATLVLLVKWDNNHTSTKASNGISDNLNKEITYSGAAFSSYAAGSVSGVNTINLNTWTVGGQWQVSFTTEGYSNIMLSSKQYGSNTGPRDFKVQYSLDNTTWTDVPNSTVTVGNNWTTGVLNVPLPVETDNQPIVYVRWIVTSTASVNGGTIAQTGTSRIDQIFVKGVKSTEVPDPGDETDISVIGVNVNTTELELTVGDTDSSVIATVEPANATNQFVLWSSSDASVAQVNEHTGLITAVGTGTAIITVTAVDGNHSQQITITVIATDGGNGTDPDGGSGTDPDGGSGTDPDGGNGTDPDGGSGTDPDGGSGTDPDGGSGTDPDGGSGTDPDGGSGTDPDGGSGTDPDGGSGTDPDGGSGTDPDGGSGTDPDGGSGTDPDGGSGTDPDGGSGTDPDGGSGTDPDGGSGTDPDGGSGTDPDGGSGTDPDGGNGTDPDQGGGITPPDNKGIITPPSNNDEITIGSDEIRKSNNGKVTLVVPAGTKTIKLPSNTAELLGSNSLEVKLDNVTVVVPSSLIQQLSIKVSASELIESTISLVVSSLAPTKEIELIANNQSGSDIRVLGKIYEFKLQLTTADGRAVNLTTFDQPIVIRLKVDASINLNLAGIYYISDNGELEYVGGKYIDGYFVAEVSHFSKYAVLEVNKFFADVSTNHWAANVIKELAAKQIISGTSATTFEPERSITRAEFVALLVRVLGLSEKGELTFKDVGSNEWYTDTISIAVKAGIVKGKSASIFAPNAKITREEMAVMLMNAYGILKGHASTSTDASFTDMSSVSSWAQQDVQSAAALQLLQGRSAGKFVPKGITSRAEAAQAIHNLLNK